MILLRAINSLFLTKIFLTHLVFVTSVKMWWCLQKASIIQNDYQNAFPETPHDLVEQYSCSTDQKSCMYNECTDCSNGKLCESLNNADSNLQSDSDSDSDSSNLISFYRWETPDKHVSKVRISVNYDEAIDRFKESVTQLKRHIYSKRSQNRFYNGIKESLDYGTDSCSRRLCRIVQELATGRKFKVLISETILSVFSLLVATPSRLVPKMLKMAWRKIRLLLWVRAMITIEQQHWPVWKRWFWKLKRSTLQSIRKSLFGAMAVPPNLDLALCSVFWQATFLTTPN